MKKLHLSLVGLCCLVYFTSYITRTNYGAVMAELIPALGITKSLASLAVTGSFITYGLGQLFCGWLGDRIQPRTMIAVGLFCTASCNLIMPLLAAPIPMAVLWSFNGFFQSMLWPPLIRMMADHMTAQEYATATVSVNAMASVGTIFIYLATPVCITLASWRAAFLIPAVFGFAMTAFWLMSTRSYISPRRTSVAGTAGTGGVGRLILASALPVTILAIVLQGIIRDGVNTWMPVYLTESFQMSNRISILISAVLPLCSILGIMIASWMDRVIGNELRSACLMFALAAVCGLVLIPLWNRSVILVLLIFSILYATACGINLMLISRVPQHFRSYGCISVISGLLNAFTYVGSSISSFSVGRLAERFDWQTVLIFWTGAALLGILFTLLPLRTWKSFVHPQAAPGEN